MLALRWLGAGLLWIVAGVVGLLGVLTSITIILLPVGIPLLMLARKIVGLASALLLPRAVRHPAKEVGDRTSDTAGAIVEGGRGLLRKGRKSAPDVAVPDAGKLRKKAARRLGRRRGVDRLKPWK